MKKRPHIVLGIDPGLTNLGYAILKDGKFVCSGCTHFVKEQSEPERLFLIVALLYALWSKRGTRPSVIGIERCFGGLRGSQTYDIGRVIGVVEQWAWEHNVTMLFVSPSTAKKHATGDHRADKAAMLAAGEKIKGSKILKADHHEADAICIAAWAEEQSGGMK